jgi:hypothetical protein
MGLDTKTYWLTDRQSQCDFNFDLGIIFIVCILLREYNNINLRVQPSAQQMFIDLNHTTCFDP